MTNSYTSQSVLTDQKEWFERWFNHHYNLVYGHRTDEEAESFTAEWPIWDQIPAGGLCLDIGCGSGRYSRTVAKRGLDVIGLDISETLLSSASQNPLPSGSGSVNYVQSDMRYMPFSGGFSLIISMFTSFGYFNSDTEHLKLLTECCRLCADNACLILDLPNPYHTKWFVKEHPSEVSVKNGLTISMERTYESASKRVIKQIKIEGNGVLENYTESVRLFEPSELLILLTQAGFRQTTPFWGDYKGSPMGPDSPRMVFFGVRHIGTD